MTDRPGRGPGDLRRDHRRPAALRPRAPAGDDAVAEVLGAGRRAVHRRAARGPVPLVELRHPDPAVRRRDRGRSATPGTMFKVGAAALQTGLAHSLVILLRAMGTPAPGLPQAAPRRREVQHDVDDGGPRVRGRRRPPSASRCTPGYEHSRLDCIYAQGLLTHRARRSSACRRREIEHDECESDGAPGLHLPPDLGPAEPAPAPAAATGRPRTWS